MIPFFAFAPAIRCAIDTNALESVQPGFAGHQTRRHVPTNAAAATLIWFALRNINRGLVESRELLAPGDEPIREPVGGPPTRSLAQNAEAHDAAVEHLAERGSPQRPHASSTCSAHDISDTSNALHT